MNELNKTGQNKGCRNKPTSMPANDAYRSNYDRIFGKSKPKKEK